MTEATHSSPTEPNPHDRISALTDRRNVLKVAGVVVGAGALAACSSPPVPAGTPDTSVGASSTAGASSSSSAATTDAGSGGGAAGGQPTSEIPVGGGKIFADTKTVVTQPTAGTFKAFDAVCPHQGCTVGSVDGGQIVCPCHQSHFDIATGDRVSGPAQTGLTAKTITVSGDSFTVS
ncbi:hypothetical protein GCM10023258_01440 [Terrabacter aeriphilus]|uniref:Cytochrome bc1 complex Rieske iron-sulfur subunit n=1 Tax=Terrabacter aeriphilus TaxID=515662 RepID=A0ABP9J098_9MICO